MSEDEKSIVILMADDDSEDRFLAQEALSAAQLRSELRFVEDGEELLDYLLHRGQYCDMSSSPRPGLILLDLNMPRMDGREALKELKADPELRRIPVVVFTTSRAEEDIARMYECGASSFITKPVTFDGLVDVMKTLKTYWFDLVQLPSTDMEI